MNVEVQKALNQLYHSGDIDIELLNLVISYIEMLESENDRLKLQIAKLVKLYDQK